MTRGEGSFDKGQANAYRGFSTRGASAMRAAWPTLLGLVAILALVVSVQAEDKDKNKEQTLKGTITCAKCGLHVKGQTKCATVIQVKDKKGKETVYYFDTASNKKYHKKICQESAKGEVTGTVSEKDGKKTIKVTKVKYEEEKAK
jgi:Cu/Zn superoxide dismutase